VTFFSNGLKYDEVNELERTIGNRNNDIKELNIDLKEKDRLITSLSSKLKDKDKNVKALQQQFSEAEAERYTLFVFVWHGGVQQILCCLFCFVFACLVYPVLPVPLDYPFLIAPSVFSNVYHKFSIFELYGWNLISVHITCIDVTVSFNGAVYPENTTHDLRQKQYHIQLNQIQNHHSCCYLLQSPSLLFNFYFQHIPY
jgi:uncharacterized coiled-coil protein SlyX